MSRLRGQSISIDQIPDIPRLLDPISSSLINPQPPKRRKQAKLRKCKSMPYGKHPTTQDNDATDEPNLGTDRAVSPVQANTRRRRSMPSGAQKRKINRGKSGSKGKQDGKSQRKKSTDTQPDLVDERSVFAELCLTSSSPAPTPVKIATKLPVTRIGSKNASNTSIQRSQSRGRIRTRQEPSTPATPIHRNDSGHSRASAVSSPSHDDEAKAVIENQDAAPRPQDQSTLALRRDQSAQTKKPNFVTKGAFLVKPAENFKFPKSQSQPEPLWRAGDGFSGDEGNPDFIFFVTGKHKRKRKGHKASADIGSLSMEKDSGITSSIRASGKRQRLDEFPQHRRHTICRGEKKDVWPTMEDFIESTLPERVKPVAPVPDDDDMPIVFSSHAVPGTYYGREPQQTMNYIPKRKSALDFWYLGREAEDPEDQETNFAEIRAWRTYLSDNDEDHEGSDESSIFARTDYGQMTEDEQACSRVASSSASSRSGSPCSAVSYWDHKGNHVFRGDIEDAHASALAEKTLEEDALDSEEESDE